MTDERSNGAFQKNIQIPPPSASKALRKASSTTVETKHSTSPTEEEGDPPNRVQEAIPSRVKKPAPANVDTWQGDTPSQICLCQPDPKVPRPRNGKLCFSDFSPLPTGYKRLMCNTPAFILYRQHHQASVVAQNPGVANPEISKVIGDHWRASTAEVKEHWKLLAEVLIPASSSVFLPLPVADPERCRKRKSATRSNIQTIAINPVARAVPTAFPTRFPLQGDQ